MLRNYESVKAHTRPPLPHIWFPRDLQAILHRFADLLPSFLPWQKDGRADVSFLRREFGDMEVPVIILYIEPKSALVYE